MSQRAQRSSTRKQPAVAAAAVDEDASMKPAAATKGKGKKRAAPSAAASAAAATAAATASDVDEAPTAKRARGKKATSSATAVAVEGEDDEKERSAAPASPAKHSKAESFRDTLDRLGVPAHGRLFSTALLPGASGSGSRPALPLCLLQLLFDFMPVRELVVGLAAASRAGYASVLEYGELVQTRSGTDDEAAAVSSNDTSSSSSSSSAAAASSSSSRARGGKGKSASSAAASHPARQPGVRSDVVTVHSEKIINLLMASRLRSLVTGIAAVKAPHDYSFSLDVKILPRLSKAMPHLRSLECTLLSTTAPPPPRARFPSLLRNLHLTLDARPSFIMTKSWASADLMRIVMFLSHVISELLSLESLTFKFSAGSEPTEARGGQWLRPLVALPRLRTLSGGDTASSRTGIRYTDYSRSVDAQFFVNLREISTLETIKDLSADFNDEALKTLLAPPHNLVLKEMPLDTITITDEIFKLLLALKPTLTSLCPDRWSVADISELKNFTRLRALSFHDNSVPSRHRHPYGYFGAGSSSDPLAVPSLDQVMGVVLAPTVGPRLTSLTISYFANFADAALKTVVDTCVELKSLEIASKAITSLELIGTNKRLQRQLQHLKLTVPNVPRDHVAHLLTLVELQSLSIAGSFLEPLFMIQLQNFQPPYPKAPLWQLRKFTPRSNNEAVPAPPVNLAAVAVAQAEFGARVQAGQVCTAELLNTAQLSGVLAFLSTRDFSFAGRTCRTWRSAASLPSAWGMRRVTTGMLERSHSTGGSAADAEASGAAEPIDHAQLNASLGEPGSITPVALCA